MVAHFAVMFVYNLNYTEYGNLAICRASSEIFDYIDIHSGLDMFRYGWIASMKVWVRLTLMYFGWSEGN